MCGSMPRQDQYQQKAHKHKIHTCPFSCLLNPSVDMNSATHSNVTGRRQKDFCGSTIDTVAEVEFSEHPPIGLLCKSNNATQVYSKSSWGRIFTLAPESWVCLHAQYLKVKQRLRPERAERFVITVTRVKWGAVKEEMLHLCLYGQWQAGPGYLKASVASS